MLHTSKDTVSLCNYKNALYKLGPVPVKRGSTVYNHDVAALMNYKFSHQNHMTIHAIVYILLFTMQDQVFSVGRTRSARMLPDMSVVHRIR